MTEDNKARLNRIQNYAKVIEKESGKAVRPYRSDSYVNMMNKYGTSKDVSEHYVFEQEPIVDDLVLEINYEGNGLFAKIIDTPAEEAIKHGFDLVGVTDKKVIEFYKEALDELDWEESAMTALKWARLFGGSIAVMLINDGGRLEDPVNWRAIRSIDDIRVYDRSVVVPDYSSLYVYDSQNPFGNRGSRLGMPQYYDVFSKYGTFRVHDSRCLVFSNGVLPERCTNSNYQIWGMPEYVRIKKAIKNADIAHGTAPKMLDRSVQAIYKMKDLSTLLSTEEGEDIVLKRLQVIDMARGLLNSIALDSEGEEYDFRSLSYSGVKDVIDTTCNFLSAVTSIPQTILFGRSPAGMNSTGRGDMENYYNYVERIQKRVVRKNLRYLLSIIFQAGVRTGEIESVPKIDIEFKPLWSLTETEMVSIEQQKAQVQLTNAQTAQTYVGMGALKKEEVRDKLASEDDFTIETVINASNIENDYVEAMLELEQKERRYGGEMPAIAARQEPNVAEESAAEEPNTKEPNAEEIEIPKEKAKPTSHAMEGSNAPDAAPTATKLPQDMSPTELEETKTDSENLGSVGVLVVKNGKILSAIRKNDTGRGLICGPGGHIEPGEDALTAAIRETQEEFGITPTDIIEIGKGPYEYDSGLQPVLFLCTEYEGELITDEDEMTCPVFLDLETLEQLKPSMFHPFANSINILRLILDEQEKEKEQEIEKDTNELNYIDKYDICDIISLRRYLEQLKPKQNIQVSDVKDIASLVDFIKQFSSSVNFDVSNKKKKKAYRERQKSKREEPKRWITVNGTPVPLDESGIAIGGHFKGSDFSDANSSGSNDNSSNESIERKSPKPEDEVGTVEKPSTRGRNVSCKKFENEELLKRHWEHPIRGHGWQFPDCKDALEYQERADKLLTQPCGDDIDGYLSYCLNPDGTKEIEVCRFNRKTGEYAKGIPGKRIKTYFIAKYDKGTKFNVEKAIKYFEAAKLREEI